MALSYQALWSVFTTCSECTNIVEITKGQLLDNKGDQIVFGNKRLEKIETLFTLKNFNFKYCFILYAIWLCQYQHFTCAGIHTCQFEWHKVEFLFWYCFCLGRYLLLKQNVLALSLTGINYMRCLLLILTTYYGGLDLVYTQLLVLRHLPKISFSLKVGVD